MNRLILLAAGSGNRMNGAVPDKILAPLAGQPLFLHSLHSFARSGAVRQTVITCRDAEQQNTIEAHIPTQLRQSIDISCVTGGSTRQQSVLAALRTLPADTETVFVHDAARPLVSIESIQALHHAVQADGAAALARPVNDTIKRLPSGAGPRNAQLEDLQRNRLWAMETPQAFPFASLLQAYQLAEAQNRIATDDAAAFAALGKTVTLVANQYPNPKLTTPGDLPYLEYLLTDR